MVNRAKIAKFNDHVYIIDFATFAKRTRIREQNFKTTSPESLLSFGYSPSDIINNGGGISLDKSLDKQTT